MVKTYEIVNRYYNDPKYIELNAKAEQLKAQLKEVEHEIENMRIANDCVTFWELSNRNRYEDNDKDYETAAHRAKAGARIAEAYAKYPHLRPLEIER